MLSRPLPSLPLPLLAAAAAGPAPLAEPPFSEPFLLAAGTLLLLPLLEGLPPAREDTKLPRLKGQLPMVPPSLLRTAPLLPASPSSSPLPLLLSPMLPAEASREPYDDSMVVSSSEAEAAWQGGGGGRQAGQTGSASIR